MYDVFLVYFLFTCFLLQEALFSPGNLVVQQRHGNKEGDEDNEEDEAKRQWLGRRKIEG